MTDCKRCNNTGEVKLLGVMVTCKCMPEYYNTCSVAEWHGLSNEKKVALIDYEIAKCGEEDND